MHGNEAFRQFFASSAQKFQLISKLHTWTEYSSTLFSGVELTQNSSCSTTLLLYLLLFLFEIIFISGENP